MTLLILVFGEIIPKALFHAHATRFALMIARPLTGLVWVLTPVTYLFEKLSLLALKLFGSKDGSFGASEKDISALTEIAAESGAIEEMEKQIIDHVFEWNDIPVKNVMTPKSEMHCLDGQQTLKDIRSELVESPYSRMPIYKDSSDNIVGILYVRDTLPYMLRNDLDVPITTIMKPQLLVPEQKKLDDLFGEFQRKRVHIAIVVNEHGDTVGLITMEDLLEELVGEIDDERDVKQVVFERLRDDSIRVHGNTDLEELEEELKLELPQQEHQTLHGLLLDTFQRIPRPGDQAAINGWLFTVEAATRKRILKVRIDKEKKKLDAENSSEKEDTEE